MGFQIEDAPIRTGRFDAEYVRRGVKDTATAETITALGAAGMDVYKGVKGAQIEAAIDPDVAGYYDAAVAEGLDVPGYTSEIAGDITEAQAFAAHVETGEFTEEEDPAYKSAIAGVKKLQRAAASGAMSSVELKARIEAKMKEFYNDAPGLYAEFKGVADEVLGKNKASIAYIEAQRSAATKTKSSPNKYLDGLAKDAAKVGMPVADIYSGDPAKVAEIQAEVKTRWPIYEAATKYASLASTSGSVRTLTANQQNIEAPLYIADSLLSYEAKTLDVLGVSSLGELATLRSDTKRKADAMGALRKQADDAVTAFNTKYRLTDTSRKTAYANQIEARRALYEKFLTGKFEAEDLETSIKSLRNGEAMRFAGYSGKELRAVMGMDVLAPNAVQNTYLSQVALADAGNAIAKQVLDMSAHNSDYTPYSTIYDKGRYSPEAVNAALTDINKYLDSNKLARESGEHFHPGIFEFDLQRSFIVLNGFENPATKENVTAKQYMQIFTALSKPDYAVLKDKFKGQMTQVENLAANAVDGYVAKASQNIKKAVIEDKTILNKIGLNVDKYGRMEFIPTAPEHKHVADNFNATYKLGTLSKAWSNIFDRPQMDLVKSLQASGNWMQFGVYVDGKEMSVLKDKEK